MWAEAEEDWLNFLNYLEWFGQQSWEWTRWAERSLYLRFYNLRYWFRHVGPLPSYVWTQMQFLSRGRLIRMLGGPQKIPAEEEWELIEVKKNQLSRTVSLYEPHDAAAEENL